MYSYFKEESESLQQHAFDLLSSISGSKVTAYKQQMMAYNQLTLWRPAAFEDFRKKTPKRTWLCTRISLLL